MTSRGQCILFDSATEVGAYAVNLKRPTKKTATKMQMMFPMNRFKTSTT